jgi:hypothetical protein
MQAAGLRVWAERAGVVAARGLQGPQGGLTVFLQQGHTWGRGAWLRHTVLQA